MTIRNVFVVALFTLGGTAVWGWWAVPIVAGVWGLVSHRRSRPGRTAAVGGVLAWFTLLVWSAFEGPIWVLAARLGGVFGIGTNGYFFVALVFPLAVAGSAATFSAALKRALR